MHRLLFTCLLSAGLAPTALAETLPGPVPAEVLRVVDGDTVRVRARIWLDQSLDVSVRLAGIDAPEITRPNCRAERTQADAAKREVESVLDDDLSLTDIRFGKYAGRVVANITTGADNDLGAHLLDQGLAVREGTPDPWCDDPPSPSAGIGSTAARP